MIRNGISRFNTKWSVVVVALAACLWQTGCEFKATHRSPFAEAQSTMRTLATALESYCIDENAYPVWSADSSKNAFAGLSGQGLDKQPTFATLSPTVTKTLTTPVAYLTTIPVDPLAPIKGATFCYWVMEVKSGPESEPGDDVPLGWLLWSAGPDQRYDITIDNVAKLYDPRERTPSEGLIDVKYDPTNGAKSAGDVWRYKE